MVLHRLTLVVGVLLALVGRVAASDGVIEFTTFQAEKNAAIASLPCKWVSMNGNDATQRYDFLCKGGNWATVSLMLDEADVTGDGVARVRLLFREWPAEIHPGGGEAFVAQQFLKHVAEHFVPAKLAPEVMEAFWGARKRIWNTRGLKLGFSVEAEGGYVLRRLEIRGMASELKLADQRRANEDVRGFAGAQGGLKSVGDVDLRTVSTTDLAGVGRNPVVEEDLNDVRWSLSDTPVVLGTGTFTAVGAPSGKARDAVVPTTVKILGEAEPEPEPSQAAVEPFVASVEQAPASQPVIMTSPTAAFAPVVGGLKAWLSHVGAVVDGVLTGSGTEVVPPMVIASPTSMYVKLPAVAPEPVKPVLPLPPVLSPTVVPVPAPAAQVSAVTVPHFADVPEPESLMRESAPRDVPPELTPTPALNSRVQAPSNFDAYNKATELTKDVEEKALTVAKPKPKVVPAALPLPVPPSGPTLIDQGASGAPGPVLAPVPMPSLTEDDGALTEVPGVGLVPVSTVSKTIGLELVPAGNGEGLGTPSTPPQSAEPLQDPLRPLPQLKFVPRAVPVERPDDVIQFEDEKSQL